MSDLAYTYIMGQKPSIEMCERIKIGSAKNVEKRRDSGATWEPDLTILFTAKGSELEKEAANKFQNYRIVKNGTQEWYQFSQNETIHDDLYTWIVENFQEYDDTERFNSFSVQCEHEGGWASLIRELQSQWGFSYKILEDYLECGASTVSSWVNKENPFIRDVSVRLRLNELYHKFMDGEPPPFQVDRVSVNMPREGKGDSSMYRWEIHCDLKTLAEIMDQHGDKISCPSLAPFSK